MIFICLLRYNHLVKCMTLNATIVITFGDKWVKKVRKKAFIFDEQDGGHGFKISAGFKQEEISIDSLKKMNPDNVKILIKIEVVEIKGFDDVVIEEAKWNEYGVI